MHTLVSQGVAGTHLALVIQALSHVGCECGTVRAYAKQFTLPLCRNRGKVSNLFFKDELVLGDKVRHFASDVLGMVPLLYTFLIDKIKSKRVLEDHIRCFSHLHQILSILKRGIIDDVIHDTLLKVIVAHAKAFLALYGEQHAKIKFHHLYHIPEDLLRLLRMVSCFATERKNKEAIEISNASDAKIERTATIAFLNRTINNWTANVNMCKHAYLHGGGTVVQKRATSVCLPCGDVRRNDMVLLLNGALGKVVDFWHMSSDDSMVVRVHVHKHLESVYFASLPCAVIFASIDDIVEPVAFHDSSNRIVACLPLV